MGYLILYLGLLIAVSSLLLWLAEWASKRIGGVRVSLIAFVFIPMAAGVGYVAAHAEQLALWQLLLYPFCGPFFMLTVLGLALIHVAPSAVLGLICQAWAAIKTRFRL